jgi:hypothetical protein
MPLTRFWLRHTHEIEESTKLFTSPKKERIFVIEAFSCNLCRLLCSLTHFILPPCKRCRYFCPSLSRGMLAFMSGNLLCLILRILPKFLCSCAYLSPILTALPPPLSFRLCFNFKIHMLFSNHTVSSNLAISSYSFNVDYFK